MNRSDAKKIAEKITNEQLFDMLYSAKQNIKDWTERSCVNKSITIGTAWNIFTKDFDIQKSYHILSKINMIREFGEFLPEMLKIKKTSKDRFLNEPVHQEPDFVSFLKFKKQ